MVTIVLIETLIVFVILNRQDRRHAMEERYFLTKLGKSYTSKKPGLPVLESWLTVTIGAALFVGGSWMLWIFVPHIGKYIALGLKTPLFIPILFVAVGSALLFLGIKSLLSHKKNREESSSQIAHYP